MKSQQHKTKNNILKCSKSILIIVMLFIAGLSNSMAQSIQYPKVVKKTAVNILITEIKTTASMTKISFVYYNGTEDRRQYFFLHAPGSADAMYIKANGIKYKLLSTEDIASKDGITSAGPKESYHFSAYFEKLPATTKKFDLIEGENGGWDFYGVSLTESIDLNEPEQSKPAGKFRVDYYRIAIYDYDKEEWSDWKDGDNTFVININDNGDIAHYMPSGKTAAYKKISKVEEGTTENGKHYQIIKALDEDGTTFRFQLFDDEEIGLKMMYGNVLIQFAK
jgi:hypothetical protein